MADIAETITHLHTDDLLSEVALVEKLDKAANEGSLGHACIDIKQINRWKCGCPKIFKVERTFLVTIQSYQV